MSAWYHTVERIPACGGFRHELRHWVFLVAVLALTTIRRDHCMLSTASAHQGSNIVLPDLPLAGDGSAPSDNITATNTSHVSAVWTELTTHSAPLSARPSSRSFHTLTAVTIFNERYLVLLGGRDESVVRDDHWIYHIRRQQWSRIEGVSDPLLLRRAYHTAVVREGNSAVRLAPTEIWLLGGKTVLSDSSDAFTSAITKVSFRKHRKSADDPFPFDVIVSAVEDVNGLGPRAYHSASVHNRCMVVFGGFNGSHFIDVLSVFHFDTRVWRHISPRPRRAPARNSLDKVLAASPSTVKSSAIGSPANPRASDATRREDPCEAPIDASNRSSVAASRMRSTSPLQSSSIAPPPPAAAECRECHAVDGCIHTSLLSALLPARQVYSATTAGLTSSIPPRDASMMVSGCGPAGRLVLFGGEVAYAFFSSVYSLDVHVGLNGSVTAEWYVASTGEEINRDGIAGNTSLSLSLTSRTSEGLSPLPRHITAAGPSVVALSPSWAASLFAKASRAFTVISISLTRTGGSGIARSRRARTEAVPAVPFPPRAPAPPWQRQASAISRPRTSHFHRSTYSEGTMAWCTSTTCGAATSTTTRRQTSCRSGSAQPVRSSLRKPTVKTLHPEPRTRRSTPIP
jgi:hypothetical protein